MRILVTGGAGFIGSHLAEGARRRDHEVAVLDDLSTGQPTNVPAGVRLEVCDLASPSAARFVAAFRPQAVFHHAARVSVRDSVADPVADAATNVLGSLALLEACRTLGDVYVVFASTGGAMYGRGARVPTAEIETPRPLSPYGCAKRAVEVYLGYYREVHGLRSCALRYANVYGPRQDPHGEAGVVAIFAARALAGEPLTVFGDGSQTRDYVHVSDIVAANLACLEARAEGAFHVGTGVETSTGDLARRIQTAAGTNVRVLHTSERPGDAARSALDASALRHAVGWQARMPLEAGLAETVAWFGRSRA